MTIAMPDDNDGDGTEPIPAHDQVGVPGHDQAMLRDREAKALRRRRLGWTYDQIAVEMGFADASGARQLILRALDRVVAEGAVHLRSLENARLDVNVQVLLGIATDAKAKPMERIRAVEAYTRLSARRARLNGLDAPVQLAVGAGSLAELDDALALLESVVKGEVTDSHELGPDDERADTAGPGADPGEAGSGSSND